LKAISSSSAQSIKSSISSLESDLKTTGPYTEISLSHQKLDTR
jgi:hypothetical protein